ncbi:Piwi-like protein 3 [Sciurus carolinensis]|uniref:Piwi-like protein 3 n=1 Tax=Sciurus carolinensis TaxID=30640 RepID=A0AA41T2N7_SCICA|nr:Piwi-like protein 3 [Sciurus carolinensis]
MVTPASAGQAMEQDLGISPGVELVSRTLNRSIVKITLNFSKELQPTHPDCVRYYNILFRRLEVLPGYVTSILPYENSLTLCADLSHKLLRMETAYDLIMKIFESNVRNFKEKVEKELVGLIVFTRYNNKTYRVDAVSWDETPRDTFTKTDGSQITYVDYYWQKYNKHVTDLSQPLLVSQGRWKKGQRLMPRSPIRLVPELCYLTGLSDAMRKNFSMMRNLSDSMRPNPMKRTTVLKNFIKSIRINKNAQRELKRWHFRLNADFLSVSGRTLKEVRIFQRDESLEKTMFVGIDCFHDIVNRRKSIAGFVASTDEELTKWYSHCIFQEPGEELVDGLKNCLKGALSSWFRNVPHAPQSIVVYRDGVGDGQLQALLDHEVPQLVSYLDQGTHSIKLTFIVVKKRINTRFFVDKTSGFENPYPGTVIDMVLTREQWYDFYIVSQSSKTGTVTPTHYNVIYDTTCLDPDTVQRLTYKLCHMYYNLPGIIRVPAPCHYAHKLAYLVGQNIHQEPDKSLSDSLYYL